MIEKSSEAFFFFGVLDPPFDWFFFTLTFSTLSKRIPPFSLLVETRCASETRKKNKNDIKMTPEKKK